jgi:hypothetical protein
MKCEDRESKIIQKAAIVSISLKAAFDFVRVRRIVAGQKTQG